LFFLTTTQVVIVVLSRKEGEPQALDQKERIFSFPSSRKRLSRLDYSNVLRMSPNTSAK
jgi:hypothetical protein